MKKEKVLVTGGAGFIGSHLCERLLNQDKNITCLDNLYTGSKENLKNILNNNEFTFIDDDILKVLNGDYDLIYNLACPASPIHYQLDPIKTIKTNILGTINVLDYAAKMNSRVLQASTSEVYGDPEIHPQIESYWGSVNPIGIRSCYDEGKRCAETLCFDYIRKYKLDIKVIRIFNTYGPRMHPDDGRVVSNFIVQALKGEPITVYGDGNQTRSFCYIDDLVDAIILMMNSNITGPINLGNPNEFKIIELAETVVQITNSTSEIKFDKLPQDDPKQRCPNISLARDKLGWKPKILLEEGLNKTINYFDSIL